jgi:hypothetical protein
MKLRLTRRAAQVYLARVRVTVHADGATILARTQAIPKQDRRKFLNDTLLFLQAADTGSVMISRNSRDLDLLLQLKPQAGVLLYDKS